MAQKIARIIMTILGGVLGLIIAYSSGLKEFVFDLLHIRMTTQANVITYVVAVILFAFIFYLLFSPVLKLSKKISESLDRWLENVRIANIVISCVGLILGLIIAALLSIVIGLIPIGWLSKLISVLVYIILGYLGFSIGFKKSDDMLNFFANQRKDVQETVKIKKTGRKKNAETGKVLDTSVLIDGRIADIIKTGFLEGNLIVPVFVLTELQLIADSSDELKRARGRRGLDIVAILQKEFKDRVIISEENDESISEVDLKLIHFVQQNKNTVLLTNDFNLNKVATVQGIKVLNINELANAVKPIVIPGEEMTVMPVKIGKEYGQAVAYLDDGTMIVVEDGRKFIGKSITVEVTSVLQTAAGRMIFAKSK